MSLGENIQFYRKKLGLSQEELARKLLVSRQTISQWEKGQTVPTTDNLIRLKEIFGVSVDEILGVGGSHEIEEQPPQEAYKFRYDKDEFKEIYKSLRFMRLKRPIVVLMLLVLFILAGMNTSVGVGFMGGMVFLYLILCTKSFFIYRRSWKKSESRVINSTYEYRFYDNAFFVNICRRDGSMLEMKCRFSDIEQMVDIGKYILLQISGRAFPLRKSQLKEISCVYGCMQNSCAAEKVSVSDKLTEVASILSAASIFSLIAGLFGVLLLPEENGAFDKSWLLYLLTPVSIACTVVGLKLKARGRKYKKNIFIGIMITVLLCVYGSFGFIFPDVYDHGNAPVLRVEQAVGVDIPEYEEILTRNYEDGVCLTRGCTYYVSDVLFGADAAEQFESRLDDKWLSSLPSGLVGISSSQADFKEYDFILLYNVDSGEFNTLPRDSWTYRFITLLYNVSEARLTAEEYDIDYMTASKGTA